MKDCSEESGSSSSDGYFSTTGSLSPTQPDHAHTQAQKELEEDEELALAKSHKDFGQVEMDVKRTLSRFPPNIADEKRIQLQERLTPLICRLLCKDHAWSYYQGFHDILLTLLLVTESEETSLCMAESLCRLELFPFLSQPMEEVEDLLQLIYVVVYQVDGDLEAYLRRAQLGTTFALSWLITWFAHSVDDYATVTRLYDLFLATHPLMPLYLSASILLLRSRELQEEMEGDMPTLHSALLKSFAAEAKLPLEALIADAADLFAAYPPSRLQNELKGAYKATVALEEEAHKTGRQLRRSVSWHLGTGIVPRPPRHPYQGRRLGAGRLDDGGAGNGIVAFTFWAVSGAAAAWYLYTHTTTWYHLIH